MNKIQNKECRINQKQQKKFQLCCYKSLFFEQNQLVDLVFIPVKLFSSTTQGRLKKEVDFDQNNQNQNKDYSRKVKSEKSLFIIVCILDT